ncbi:hypothetical protein ACFOUW_02300, partial [Tenggerimyces flavus]
MTPIWLGQPSSVCKIVLERLDAELSETDDTGCPSMSGKVAVVVWGQRGRRPPCDCGTVPGVERDGLHDPGGRGHVLGRRGHAVCRLSRRRTQARHDRPDDETLASAFRDVLFGVLFPVGRVGIDGVILRVNHMHH